MSGSLFNVVSDPSKARVGIHLSQAIDTNLKKRGPAARWFAVPRTFSADLPTDTDTMLGGGQTPMQGELHLMGLFLVTGT
ncbi:MAG: hypothetical protein V1262_03155 [Alphaproteobacteria bacterium]|nr:hypothetical protein [Alphaproteobacteria bacterium]